MTSSFAKQLKAACSVDWEAAIGHRFVDEIWAGEVPPEAMRRYLIQDYQFIDGFVALLGAAIASADQFPARVRLAQFAAMITSDENTYFQRAFDALGVSEAERTAPALEEVTCAFQALMGEAAAGLDYVGCLAVLCVAEGLYLDWADRPAAPLPPDFVHAEWISLHRNDGFRAFVDWLWAELDRLAASDAARSRAASLFARAVALERSFFDHIYAY